MEIIRVDNTNLVFDFQERNDKALFIALGQTLTEIQCFETCIYSLLSSIQDKNRVNALTDYFQNNEKKTLGQLINELIVHIPDEIVKQNLIDVRDKRNYIVHKILRKYGWPLMSDKDYLIAITEIAEIKNFINVSEPIITKYIRDNNILDLIIFEI